MRLGEWSSRLSSGNIPDSRRGFSTSTSRREISSKPDLSSSTSEAVRTKSGDNRQSEASGALPSRTDEQRSEILKRLATLMDSILARASVAGQHINNYTGTDYSGIEALRNEIMQLEDKVKTSHDKIDIARKTHRDAHDSQAAAQKEIVSLLERKSSWSPTDLERYMSLVRSEHTNEQAVQAAKDGLNAAEKDLESTRSLLERQERKQYHEEQIWSDTIRRNSTWVTFGLMGVNIVLLLAQIGIFEPYRRHKIVREVKEALNERAVALPISPEVQRQVDEVVEPGGVPLEALEETATTQQPHVLVPEPRPAAIAGEQPSQAPPTAGIVLVEDTAESLAPSTLPSQHPKPSTWSEEWEAYKQSLQDLFSERLIQVKKVDITTTALQGAATGVAAMGLLFVLWRPK